MWELFYDTLYSIVICGRVPFETSRESGVLSTMVVTYRPKSLTKRVSMKPFFRSQSFQGFPPVYPRELPPLAQPLSKLLLE